MEKTLVTAMLASVKQRLDQILDSSNKEDASSTAQSTDNVSPIPDDIIETTASEYDISTSRLTKRLSRVQNVAESALVPPPEEDNPIARLIRASGDKQTLEREIHVDDELLVVVAIAERWQELAETLNTTSFADSYALEDAVTDAEQEAMQAAHAAKTRELGYAAQAELLNPLVVKTEDITIEGEHEAESEDESEVESEAEGTKAVSDTVDAPETEEEQQVVTPDDELDDERGADPSRDDEVGEKAGETSPVDDSPTDDEKDGEFEFSEQTQADREPDGDNADPAATNGTEPTTTANGTESQESVDTDIDEDTEESLESVLSEATAQEDEPTDEDSNNDSPEATEKTDSDEPDTEMGWLLDSDIDDAAAEDDS
jgi:hypothetical protein